MHLHHAEIAHQNLLQKGCTVDDCETQLRRIGNAERRYMAAIRELAQVRRMQLPMMQIAQIALPGATQIGQVNVGEKQVNVTTTVTGQATAAGVE